MVAIHVYLQNKNDFLACYTTRITDIGTLFSSGHEANADENHETLLAQLFRCFEGGAFN